MIELPRTGNYLRAQWLVIKHRCWRDRVPWYGRRHLLRIVREAGYGDGN